MNPSSAARALLAGAKNIERADFLVQTLAAQKGMQLDVVDETVALVDSWLAPDHRYFKVQVEDDSTYILRHDVAHDSWEIVLYQESLD